MLKFLNSSIPSNPAHYTTPGFDCAKQQPEMTIEAAKGENRVSR
jgi:hypothetical protein